MIAVSLGIPIDACTHTTEGVFVIGEGSATRYIAVARVEPLALDDEGFNLAADEAQAMARVRLRRRLPEELRGSGPNTLQGVLLLEVCRRYNHVFVAVEASAESVYAARALAEASRKESSPVDKPQRRYE